jgi:hypothetical protein
VNWPNLPAGAYILETWASAGGSVVLDAGTAEGDPTPAPSLDVGAVRSFGPHVSQTAGPQATAGFTEPVPANGTSLFIGRFDAAPTVSEPDSVVQAAVHDAGDRTCATASRIGNAQNPQFMAVDVRAVLADGNHTWSGSSQVTARVDRTASAYGVLIPLVVA